MDPKKLYFAAGLLAAGVPLATLQVATSANAMSKQERVHVKTEYLSTNSALQTIKAKVKAAQCPVAESQEGMPAGSCEVTPGSNTCIYWGDDADPESMTRVDSGFLFGAQLAWDPSQP